MGEDKYFLACGGDLTGAVTGIADGARVSGDPIGSGDDPTWDTVLYSVRAASRMYFLHDYSAERPRHPDGSATADHGRGGGLGLDDRPHRTGALHSDILPEVPSSGSRYYRRPSRARGFSRAAIPGGAPERLRPQDPAGTSSSGTWWGSLQLAEGARRCLRSRLNLRFEDLGCDPGSTYLVYDYWVTASSAHSPATRRRRGIPELPRSTAIREYRGVPQLVSVDQAHHPGRGFPRRAALGSYDELSIRSVEGPSRSSVHAQRPRAGGMACPERGGGRRRTRAASGSRGNIVKVKLEKRRSRSVDGVS